MISSITSEIRGATTATESAYGSRLNDIIPKSPNLPQIRDEHFTLCRSLANEMVKTYSQDSDSLDTLVKGHASDSAKIFAPLAKLVAAIKAHRSIASSIECLLKDLRSKLGDAFKPLIDSAISNENTNLAKRAASFFDHLRRAILENPGSDPDFDFLRSFKPYDPDDTKIIPAQ